VFHEGSVEIPDDPELEVDLTARNTASVSKAIQLERKGRHETPRGWLRPTCATAWPVTIAVDIAFRTQRQSQLVFQFPSPNALLNVYVTR